MINTVFASGTLRHPRAILMVGGTAIKWETWTMEHSGVYEAGILTVTVVDAPDNWNWWLGQTEIVIDVYVGFPNDPSDYSASDLTLMMSARMDSIKLDPTCNTFVLSGRDLTSLFADNKSSEKYQNKTSSEIIGMLCAQQPDIMRNITETTGSVGAYYAADQVTLQKETSMWTLMTYLAQHEGFDIFVLGRTLYFGKFGSPQFGSAVTNEPYQINFTPSSTDQPVPNGQVERIQLSHNLTISGDITVKVRSFHGFKGAAYIGTATASKKQKASERSASVVQTAQTYEYTFPNLTKEDCEARAQKLLEDFSKHEVNMEVTIPGDVNTFPWTPIVLTGTGTIFDSTYTVTRIMRSFDARGGYTQTIHCRNAPAEQTVTIQ